MNIAAHATTAAKSARHAGVRASWLRPFGVSSVSVNAPAIQVISDPVKGEVQKVVAIRPRVDLRANAPVLVFENEQTKTLEVTLAAQSGAISGKLVAEAPEGWSAQIEDPDFSLSEAIRPSVFLLP